MGYSGSTTLFRRGSCPPPAPCLPTRELHSWALAHGTCISKVETRLKAAPTPQTLEWEPQMAFSDRRSGNNTAAGAFGCATSYEVKTGFPGGLLRLLRGRTGPYEGFGVFLVHGRHKNSPQIDGFSALWSLEPRSKTHGFVTQAPGRSVTIGFASRRAISIALANTVWFPKISGRKSLRFCPTCGGTRK